MSESAYQHLRLLPGQYYLGLGIFGDRGYDDGVNDAVQFEITSTVEAAQIDAHHFGGALVASAKVSILNPDPARDTIVGAHGARP